jgi:hypothetical protein
MADAPEFTRGEAGDPNNPQPDYGAASEVNQLATTDQTTQQPDPNAPVPGITGRPAPPLTNPNPADDTKQWLLRPTDRPDEPVTHGLTPDGKLRPPPDLMDWLPDLQAAAQIPDAPPAVRILYDAIAQQVS